MMNEKNARETELQTVNTDRDVRIEEVTGSTAERETSVEELAI